LPAPRNPVRTENRQNFSHLANLSGSLMRNTLSVLPALPASGKPCCNQRCEDQRATGEFSRHAGGSASSKPANTTDVTGSMLK
jgi:hypothetical protein